MWDERGSAATRYAPFRLIDALKKLERKHPSHKPGASNNR
jgi:hypothetical protein